MAKYEDAFEGGAPGSGELGQREDGASSDFGELLLRVRSAVHQDLERHLDLYVKQAEPIAPSLAAVVTSMRALALRGGKRFRAALLAASYEACSGKPSLPVVIPAAAALELLQVYLLIHDDWMDDDDLRRGGPSVHVALRQHFVSRQISDASAILAGDFAAALAQASLFETSLPADRVLAAARDFTELQTHVVMGQVLDVHSEAKTKEAVERVHDLKTASYTVTGPVLMGASLAGASAEQKERLRRFSVPVGIAFQLRDDILGTFGDPDVTGKPTGGDLRKGKQTALVAELQGDRHAQALLSRVFGVSDAPEIEVAALVARLVDSGAKTRVEARISGLLAEAETALSGCSLTKSGSELFRGAVRALGLREH